MLNFWDPSAGEKVTSASRDTTNFQYSWIGKHIAGANPLKPNLMQDNEEEKLENNHEYTDIGYKDVLNRIRYEDERADYSFASLTPD